MNSIFDLNHYRFIFPRLVFIKEVNNGIKIKEILKFMDHSKVLIGKT